MSDKTFVDTNILVYAHDLDAGKKHEKAKKTVIDLWETEAGVISTQVLQEFYVTLTRKVPTPLKKSQVRRILNNYMVWEVAVNNGKTILQAIEIEENYNISFWDAMIVSAAYLKNAAVILTEDLNEGQITSVLASLEEHRESEHSCGKAPGNCAD
ncbi:MAG: PIN domain-containing protein [Desulfobacterales bacterium]